MLLRAVNFVLLTTILVLLGCDSPETLEDGAAERHWRGTESHFGEVVSAKCEVLKFWSNLPEDRLYLMSVTGSGWSGLTEDIESWLSSNKPYWSHPPGDAHGGVVDQPGLGKPPWWSVAPGDRTEIIRIQYQATLGANAGRAGYNFYYLPDKGQILVESWTD